MEDRDLVCIMAAIIYNTQSLDFAPGTQNEKRMIKAVFTANRILTLVSVGENNIDSID